MTVVEKKLLKRASKEVCSEDDEPLTVGQLKNQAKAQTKSVAKEAKRARHAASPTATVPALMHTEVNMVLCDTVCPFQNTLPSFL